MIILTRESFVFRDGQIKHSNVAFYKDLRMAGFVFSYILAENLHEDAVENLSKMGISCEIKDKKLQITL